jgi:hypothetical protein
LKKIKTSIIVILAVLLIAITGFNIYIRCANRMPYVFATHTVYVQYQHITYSYSNKEIKHKLEDLVGVKNYNYNEKNIKQYGRTQLMFRAITIRKNLSQLDYIEVLCHELLHLKHYTLNERSTQYKTFKTLYNSEFKQIALNIAYKMQYGEYPYEYECYAQIVEYLEKQPI